MPTPRTTPRPAKAATAKAATTTETATEAFDEPAPANETSSTDLLKNPPQFIRKGDPIPDGHVVFPAPASFGKKMLRIMPAAEYAARLAHLTTPFDLDEIEKLPKQIKAGDDVRGRCEAPQNGGASPYSADGHHCGGWHARSVHIDYVGHATITLRVLEVDPLYYLDVIERNEQGLPGIRTGGTFARLTILGMTREGFGDASGKSGPNAVKETIGDALRNAAMRFGVGTYLWSKADYAIALKTEAGDPADDERAFGVTEPQFWNAVNKALATANPASALTSLRGSAPEEGLRSLVVTLKDRSKRDAYSLLTDLIEKAPSEPGERAPRESSTHLTSALPGDDQWTVPAPSERAPDERETAERAHDESAVNERTPEEVEREREQEREKKRAAREREDAENQARGERALAQQDEMIERNNERLDRGENLMKARLLDEVTGHAQALGISIEQYGHELVTSPRSTASSLAEVPPPVLRAFVFKKRALVIEALFGQGKVTEASALRAANERKEVNTWALLTRAQETTGEQGALDSTEVTASA